MELHGEKAPGPDGFTGDFFKKCWMIIKDDLVKALKQLHCLRGNKWNLLNTAHIVMLPKKENAENASDFRPMSVMHSVAKIVCKVLATRLGPELKSMVSNNQSAFIKTRSIHDNFLYVKNVVKDAHKKKKSLLFIRLDIAKAFDSVHWSYILEVLRGFGFGNRWCDLVSFILASSSSKVLLNGTPGRVLCHKRGLRQGDPLSPLLFILMMEPLHKLFQKATDLGLLSPLGLKTARTRSSFYADDAALFLNPIKEEMIVIQKVLHIF
jgi:hypothetical protein